MALTMAASMAGCNAGSQPAAGMQGKIEAASSVQEKSGTEDKGGSGQKDRTGQSRTEAGRKLQDRFCQRLHIQQLARKDA